VRAGTTWKDRAANKLVGGDQHGATPGNSAKCVDSHRRESPRRHHSRQPPRMGSRRKGDLRRESKPKRMVAGSGGVSSRFAVDSRDGAADGGQSRPAARRPRWVGPVCAGGGKNRAHAPAGGGATIETKPMGASAGRERPTYCAKRTQSRRSGRPYLGPGVQNEANSRPPVSGRGPVGRNKGNWGGASVPARGKGSGGTACPQRAEGQLCETNPIRLGLRRQAGSPAGKGCETNPIRPAVQAAQAPTEQRMRNEANSGPRRPTRRGRPHHVGG
jgi:hypothetical protein